MHVKFERAMKRCIQNLSKQLISSFLQKTTNNVFWQSSMVDVWQVSENPTGNCHIIVAFKEIAI